MSLTETERSAKLSVSAQKRWKRVGEINSQSIRMQQMWCDPAFRKRHRASLANKTYSAKGSIWITNGTERQRINPGQDIPTGWWKGKEMTQVKPAKITMRGSLWITDGHTNRRIGASDTIPDGWQRGRS